MSYKKDYVDGIYGLTDAPSECPQCGSWWSAGERLHTGDDRGIGGWEDWVYCSKCDQDWFYPVVYRPTKA